MLYIYMKKGILYALVGRTKPRDTRTREEACELRTTWVCVSVYYNWSILISQNDNVWVGAETEDGVWTTKQRAIT